VDRQRLIDAIVEDPTNLDAWVVYADWLSQRDELPGEIIQLSLAIEAGNDTDQTRGRLGHLMSQLGRRVSPRVAAIADCWEFQWWRGFPISAHIRRDDQPCSPEVVTALLADPHVGLLESLAAAEFWQPVFETPLCWLRDLAVARLGDAGSQLEAHLPQLESLSLGGTKNAVVELHHSCLRDLAAGPASCKAVVDGAFDLPALETLRWSLDEGDPLIRSPRSILHAPPASLTKLEVVIATPLLIRQLVQCPIAAQLTSLVLGTVVDDDLAVFGTHAHAFPALRELVVGAVWSEAVQDELADAQARLIEAFPQVRVDVGYERYERHGRFRSRFAPPTTDD
jgi:uncharacterized protein (TIGR02996 family)